MSRDTEFGPAFDDDERGRAAQMLWALYSVLIPDASKWNAAAWERDADRVLSRARAERIVR